MSDDTKTFIKRSRDAAWIYPNFNIFTPEGKLAEAAWPTLNDWVALNLSGNCFVHGGFVKESDVIEAIHRLAGIEPEKWSAPKFLPRFLKREYHKKFSDILSKNSEILRDIFEISFADWPEAGKKCDNGSSEASASAVGTVPWITTGLVRLTGLNILQIANLPIRCLSQLIRINTGNTDAPESNEWVANMLLIFQQKNKKG